MNEIKTKALAFLYKWVSEGKIPHIRKGMTEELEGLINQELSQVQMNQVVEGMVARKMIETLPPVAKDNSDEKDSK